mgnify:CR=1 FL=1
MAKPRVTYESTGDYLRPPQNIDFAGQRENIAAYTQMTQKLDQMSNYFMQQAEGMAKIEGAEYGALNAPTEQQLEDAFVQDKEVELPGDTFSVFGRQARAAALETVYNDLEVMAKKKILFDITDYEKQELDPSMLGEKFDTIINGYAATFDETSPTLAKKFRADVGLFAYSKLQGEMSDYLKVEKKKARAALVTSFNFATMDGGFIHTELKNMTTVIPKGGIQEGVELLPPAEELKTKIASHKYKFAKDALALGFTQTEVTTLLNDFDKRVTLIRKNIVTQEILQTEAGGKAVLFNRMETALRQGPKSKTAKELPTEVYNAIFSASATEALEIINLARQGYNNHLDDELKRINFSDISRKFDIEQTERKFNENYLNYNNPTPGIDPMVDKVTKIENMKDSLNVLQQRGETELFEKYSKSFDLITGELPLPVKDDTQTVTEFQIDIVMAQPAKTLADVHTALQEGKLTLKTFQELSEKYITLTNSEDTAVIKEMRAKFNLSEVQVANKGFLKSSENVLFNTALNRYYRDKRAGGNAFVPTDWLKNIFPIILEETPTNTGDLYFTPGLFETAGEFRAFIDEYGVTTQREFELQLTTAASESLGDVKRLEKLTSDKEKIDKLQQDPKFDFGFHFKFWRGRQ